MKEVQSTRCNLLLAMDNDKVENELYGLFRAEKDYYPHATNFADLPELAPANMNAPSDNDIEVLQNA